ncbi:hypothetical protein BKA61DRAFT_738009 [Leptodontidium sp. MPI-SDFR-AT-0119]|nr:hypothetical protein BKA61DRAFT_738009 [Leptodontidium sp. MPI-SDFR-AT-0119]
MHFTLNLLVALLGVGTTASATCFTTSGPASFKACCPTPQSSGKGTISGVVFKYTCGQFFNGGESTISASSVKECAEDLLGEKYPAPMKLGSWLTLQKTTEEPDPEQDCKELVDAAKREAESKCTTEKDRLQREGETQCRTEKDIALTNADAQCQRDKDTTLTNVNAQCQKDKDAALANANSQCAAEKDKLRADADTNAQKAQSQCTTEKDQLRQQADSARTQCQSEKDAALTNANSQCAVEKDQLRQQADTARTQCQSEKDAALTNSNSQCTAEKDQLRQQLADAARQRDTERDGLQKQLKDAQDKAGAGGGTGGGFTDSASAQDGACINNSWSSLCSGGCGHDTFTVGGVEFKRKCNVSTGGGREEQWLHRSSVMDCVRECAGIKACLGVGWIALQGVNGHCHAHMTVSGSLRTAPSRGHPLHEHHLIYAPSRANVW